MGGESRPCNLSTRARRDPADPTDLSPASGPVEFGIAPKYGEGFVKFRVQILGFCDEPRDLRWRLLAVKQQTHVDIAVDGTEAAVGEAAQLVDFDQRRPKARAEVLGNPRNVFDDFVHVTYRYR